MFILTKKNNIITLDNFFGGFIIGAIQLLKRIESGVEIIFFEKEKNFLDSLLTIFWAALQLVLL
jgi:hypothetical protein